MPVLAICQTNGVVVVERPRAERGYGQSSLSDRIRSLQSACARRFYVWLDHRIRRSALNPDCVVFYGSDDATASIFRKHRHRSRTSDAMKEPISTGRLCAWRELAARSYIGTTRTVFR